MSKKKTKSQRSAERRRRHIERKQKKTNRPLHLKRAQEEAQAARARAEQERRQKEEALIQERLRFEARLAALMSNIIPILESDSRIAFVSFVSGILSFTTHSICAQVDAHVLTIGSFRVEIRCGRQPSYEVTCVMSGCVAGSWPLYVGEAGIGFCFGNRDQFLKELLREQEYLAAAYLMLGSFGEINQSNQEYALKKYRHDACGCDKHRATD